MSETILRVDCASKKFCRSLNHTMLYGASDLSRSFLGMQNHTEKLRKGEFWAVNEVSFELKRGECLGIIGRNGAGKSTLLKLLNGIMMPDKGRIEVKGRMGAMIDVGTGFHPLLTGRENIYVNGAILGLNRKEIEKKIGDILKFADIDDFIDTPVKYYSSGMYVRLGFAIAAHLEPDVLVIDEVLAVGDAGFRAKCYNRIASLAERTAIIFVSHVMPMISRLSTQVMVLNDGKTMFKGATGEAIFEYYNLFTRSVHQSRFGTGEVKFTSVRFFNDEHIETNNFEQGTCLRIEFDIHAIQDVENLCIDLVFQTLGDDLVAECNSHNCRPISVQSGKELRLRAEIKELTLNAGLYKVSALILSRNMVTHYDWLKDFTTINVRANHVGVAGQQFKADWILD
jgi:lipopolysaccharide transport system ATP-binding protein